MDLNKNYIKKTISLNAKPLSLDIKDKYISVVLTKTGEVFEYVDVKRDNKIYTIDRQEFNPYYINFGFFDSIQRVKVNNSIDLTSDMISYLRNNYAQEKIIEQYGVSQIQNLTDSAISLYPQDKRIGNLGIVINESDRKQTIPASNKFRLTGSGIYDGIYIRGDSLPSKLGGKYAIFYLSPNKQLHGNLVINGLFQSIVLDPNQVKLQVISDNLNSDYLDSFNDKDWDIKSWFDKVGYNLLTTTINKTTNETDLEKLERAFENYTDLLSKSYFFPININK